MKIPALSAAIPSWIPKPVIASRLVPKPSNWLYLLQIAAVSRAATGVARIIENRPSVQDTRLSPWDRWAAFWERCFMEGLGITSYLGLLHYSQDFIAQRVLEKKIDLDYLISYVRHQLSKGPNPQTVSDQEAGIVRQAYIKGMNGDEAHVFSRLMYETDRFNWNNVKEYLLHDGADYVMKTHPGFRGLESGPNHLERLQQAVSKFSQEPLWQEKVRKSHISPLSISDQQCLETLQTRIREYAGWTFWKKFEKPMERSFFKVNMWAALMILSGSLVAGIASGAILQFLNDTLFSKYGVSALNRMMGLKPENHKSSTAPIPQKVSLAVTSNNPPLAEARIPSTLPLTLNPFPSKLVNVMSPFQVSAYNGVPSVLPKQVGWGGSV